MSASKPKHRSLSQSLAILASALAISIATFLPTVVAMSPSLGVPIVLCSGGELRLISIDGDGRPVEEDGRASLKCAMALQASMVVAPPSPAAPLEADPHLREEDAPILAPQAYRLPAARGPPARPPSTAPPIA